MISQQVETEVCAFVSSLRALEKKIRKNLPTGYLPDFEEDLNMIQSDLDFLKDTLKTASKELSEEDYIKVCMNALKKSEYHKKIELSEEDAENYEFLYTCVYKLLHMFLSSFLVAYCQEKDLSIHQAKVFGERLKKGFGWAAKNSE